MLAFAACAALGVACPAVAQPAPQAAASETEAEAWGRVKDTSIAGDLRAFLAAHPAGRYMRQAQSRLLALEAKAPPPAPTVSASVALAYMVRFDAVAQMTPKLGAPPAPAKPAAAPLQLAELTTPQARGASPAAAAPAPAQTVAASPPPPSPAPEPAASAAPPAAPSVAAQPPPVQVATAAPPPPVIAPRPQSRDPMVRPEMIDFDFPILPRGFCTQQDMNSYLTDFHIPLDQAAKVNNQTATEHYNLLKARWGELAAKAPGSDPFLAVNTEMNAYDDEAKARYAMAARVNDLDARIRTIPIDPAEGCAHAPWPQAVRGYAPARPAASGD